MKTSKIFTSLISIIFLSFIVVEGAAFASSHTAESSLKTRIKNNFGITVFDNDKLDLTQLGVIESVLQQVPSALYNLKVLTVNDFLEGQNPEPNETARINIFGTKVGAATEDGIPDSTNQLTDTFSILFVHELNHRVSFKYNFEDANSKHKTREQQLLSRASTSSQQYIRSMFQDGFFQQFPQEFLASLSNAYFQDSIASLELGVSRFNLGFREPINQVLFFMDVYSQGGFQVPIYTLDAQGKLTRSTVSLSRDNSSNIKGVNTTAKQYNFTLDGNGFVTAVSSTVILPPPPPPALVPPPAPSPTPQPTASPSPPSSPNRHPSSPTMSLGPVGSIPVNTVQVFNFLSTDPDGDTLSYAINWSDFTAVTGVTGASGSPVSASHSWTLAGNYTIYVTVTDGKGGKATQTFNVTVGALRIQPPPQASTPPPALSSPPPPPPVARLGPRLVKTANNATVYYITQKGLKKAIISAKVFLSYGDRWEQVETVSQDELSFYETVEYMRLKTDLRVYKISGGIKQYITPAAAARLQIHPDKVVPVNRTEFNSYKTGTIIK